MQIGLIGKTNVGKSTFFSAATALSVQIANHPFTTIKPNVGIAYARVNCVCREFGIKDNPIHSICINGNRFVPIKLIDVAGLVPGAHQGRGLGNKFLDDARQADGLIHVVDASGSTDSEGRPCPPGTNDPLDDIKFVEEEFDLWLKGIISKDWHRIAREAEHKGKIESMLAVKLSGLSIKEDAISIVLNKFKQKKPVEWDDNDILAFAKELRRIAKPIIIAANKADIKQAEDNIKRIQEKYQAVPCSAEAELLLKLAAKKGIIDYIPGDPSFTIRDNNLTIEQRRALDKVKEFMNRYGSTGVQEVINKICLDVLKMIVVYPVEDPEKLSDKKGNVLPDAHLMPEGSTAKDLAYAIHTDLGDHFIYALDVRSKQRLGADYKLKHNDVIQIVSAKR
ncbi:MAG: redox-regulated ATPase YchF [Candidatus Nitrosocaldaceae archaeon]|nr:MAG: redox-regulated ATPase YchF [Candidatus Nitrosocaldaceae archaeon]